MSDYDKWNKAAAALREFSPVDGDRRYSDYQMRNIYVLGWDEGYAFAQNKYQGEGAASPGPVEPSGHGGYDVEQAASYAHGVGFLKVEAVPPADVKFHPGGIVYGVDLAKPGSDKTEVWFPKDKVEHRPATIEAQARVIKSQADEIHKLQALVDNMRLILGEQE